MLITLPLVWIWQRFWLTDILGWFQDSTKRAIDKMKEREVQEIRESRLIEEIEKPLKIIKIEEEDSGSEKYIEYRTRELGYITRIVGWLEIIFFAGLVYFILKYTNISSSLDRVNSFFTIFGGWIFIKTIVNYDQWSHKRAGKAYFYISLFGTFLNILLAVAIGILFFMLS